MTQPRVLLDACVLVPVTLADSLLRLAEHGFYQPVWSQIILRESLNAVRSLSRKGSDTLVRKRFTSMYEAFPTACIQDFENLEKEIITYWPDPDDAHIVAAAAVGSAEVIVTNNLKDFPATLLEPFKLRAMSPDQFLMGILELDHARVVRCLSQQARDLKNPPWSLVELVEALRKVVPEFAENLMRLLDSPR